MGDVIYVEVADCLTTQAVVCYMPEENNDYHSEIHGDESRVCLSKPQRRYLASMARKVEVAKTES